MSHRRYKTNEAKTYNHFLNLCRQSSDFLNGGGKGTNAQSKCITDLNTLKIEQKRIENKTKDLAESLANIANDFENEKQTAINSGKRPATEMTKAMQDRKFEAEARLDVYNEELETIEKLLQNVEVNGINSNMPKPLKDGAIGVGKLTGGILSMVDNQRVIVTKEGYLVIDQQNSMYHGMFAVDYFEQIVPAYKKALRQRRKINFNISKVKLPKYPPNTANYFKDEKRDFDKPKLKVKSQTNQEVNKKEAKVFK